MFGIPKLYVYLKPRLRPLAPPGLYAGVSTRQAPVTPGVQSLVKLA